MRWQTQTRWLIVALLVIIAATVIVGRQLFVQPIVGMADNGDFERLMEFGRCTHLNVPTGTRYFSHIHRVFYCEENEARIEYYSSQMILIRLAVKLAAVIWHRTYFDLRALSLLQLPILLSAISVTLMALARRPLFDSFVVGGLFLLIFCDVGYVAYFNSFYSEPGSFLWLLVTVALSLYLVLQEPRGAIRWLLLFALLLAMSLFVTAKAQNVLLGVPLALYLWRLGAAGDAHQRRRWLAAMVMPLLLLTLCVVYFQGGRKEEVKRVNLYHHVFGELLPSSSDPESDLRALELPTPYAQLSGTNWFTPGIPKDDPAFVQTFYSKVSNGKILKFYLLRPARLWGLFARNAARAFDLRPYLGNFEPSAGHPPLTLSHRYERWSAWKNSLPSKSWLLLFVFSFHLGVILYKYGWEDRTLSQRLVTELHAVLVLSGAAAYATILLGEGRGEVVRYMLIVNTFHDLALLFLVVYGLAKVRQLIARM